MSRYIPRVGTFDPDLPEWLVVGPDGRLYNINATANRLSLTEPWSPPEGWTGSDGVVFTPEGGTKPPAPPVLPPPDVPAPYKAIGVDLKLASTLVTAMRAIVAHDNELLR